MNNSRLSGRYALQAAKYRDAIEAFMRLSIVIDDESINIKAGNMFLAFYDWTEDRWIVNLDYYDCHTSERGYLA